VVVAGSDVGVGVGVGITGDGFGVGVGSLDNNTAPINLAKFSI